jgi:hypothetical protein
MVGTAQARLCPPYEFIRLFAFSADYCSPLGIGLNPMQNIRACRTGAHRMTNESDPLAQFGLEAIDPGYC